MSTRATRCSAVYFWPGSAQAQEPLSVIEWLTNPPENLPGTVLLEPPCRPERKVSPKC